MIFTTFYNVYYYKMIISYMHIKDISCPCAYVCIIIIKHLASLTLRLFVFVILLFFFCVLITILRVIYRIYLFQIYHIYYNNIIIYIYIYIYIILINIFIDLTVSSGLPSAREDRPGHRSLHQNQRSEVAHTI